MNLQPVQLPGDRSLPGHYVRLICCGEHNGVFTMLPKDAMTDLDGSPGTYYCRDCAIALEPELAEGPWWSERELRAWRP